MSYSCLELSPTAVCQKDSLEIEGSTNRIAHSCIQNAAALQCKRGCGTLDAEGRASIVNLAISEEHHAVIQWIQISRPRIGFLA